MSLLVNIGGLHVPSREENSMLESMPCGEEISMLESMPCGKENSMLESMPCGERKFHVGKVSAPYQRPANSEKEAFKVSSAD
ncbi:hypothetical protein CEXT_124671 [Caerostris extrusa]|uniref:Uncharacterized protein n=1 Tax=Caerostris extrusa TaxID=172846 RepID=A0AAV4X458_CAEEX|nr:hypothetical protein CEXT_124671 [Caerostris extrusa]